MKGFRQRGFCTVFVIISLEPMNRLGIGADIRNRNYQDFRMSGITPQCIPDLLPGILNLPPTRRLIDPRLAGAPATGRSSHVRRVT
jgi:hypothetical protein